MVHFLIILFALIFLSKEFLHIYLLQKKYVSVLLNQPVYLPYATC